MPKLVTLLAVPGNAGIRRVARPQAEATPARAPDQPWDWTPPPLPAPGGPIVQPVGLAPQRTGAPSPVENPAAGGTPGVAATPGEEIPPDTGAPPQPVATPAAAAGGAVTPAPSATVVMTPDLRFDPEEATIRVGEAVQWTNQGRAPQTVTADPVLARDHSHAAIPDGAKPFDSGVANASTSFSHTFDVAGTYSYFSIPFEEAGMLGRVVVQ